MLPPSHLSTSQSASQAGAAQQNILKLTSPARGVQFCLHKFRWPCEQFSKIVPPFFPPVCQDFPNLFPHCPAKASSNICHLQQRTGTWV